jgi:signal transduction histidine kinase
MSPATRRPPPPWLLVSAAWLGIALLAILRGFVQGGMGQGDEVTWQAIVWEGGDWFLYAFLTPAVFWAAGRWPLVPGTLARRIPLHLAASLVLCVAWAGGGVLLSQALFGQTPYGMGGVGWVLTSLPFGVAVYFALLGVEHAIRYFREVKTRDVQLAEARLGALRMQLQPHFLYNSLNAVSVVVRDHDTATASRVLDQLSEMLRRVMRTGGPPEVALAEEMEFVRQYLAIEEVRFPDRLRPVFDVDPTVERALVPEFILQPLVENAVRHGLARRTEATLVRITARREGGELVVRVTDDGPGPGAAPDERALGVGLSNTRERLQTLYGDRGRFTLTGTPTGGASAEIRLPYRESHG